MSLLTRLEGILNNGRKAWEEAEPESDFAIDHYTSYDRIKKQFPESRVDIPDSSKNNKLILGDNLSVCKYLVQNGQSGTLKLIYCDPPFYTKVDYKTDIKLVAGDRGRIPIISQKAYDDSWEEGMESYLTLLTARLYAFQELLTDDGSMWMHLDWHAVHYVKILMDQIFGEENFVNEIIWNYKSGGATKRRFARKHDTLLFYSKGGGYYFKPQREKSYNRGLKAYRFKGVKEYKDEAGWYTLVNMKDVWQLDMVGRTSAERTGYATQKPEALLARIMESCTEKGDLCADFFGGSGTLAATAEKLKRRWISCDIGKLSTVNSLKRMLDGGSSFELMTAQNRIENGLSHVTDHDCIIDVDFYVEKVSTLDMKLLQLRLEGYRLLKDEDMPVSQKDLALIHNVEKEDWLQLIDFFAVDFDYNGEFFVPDVYAAKKGMYIDSFLEKIIPAEEENAGGQIALKVIDIFGNSGFFLYNP